MAYLEMLLKCKLVKVPIKENLSYQQNNFPHACYIKHIKNINSKKKSLSRLKHPKQQKKK